MISGVGKEEAIAQRVIVGSTVASALQGVSSARGRGAAKEVSLNLKPRLRTCRVASFQEP